MMKKIMATVAVVAFALLQGDVSAVSLNIKNSCNKAIQLVALEGDDSTLIGIIQPGQSNVFEADAHQLKIRAGAFGFAGWLQTDYTSDTCANWVEFNAANGRSDQINIEVRIRAGLGRAFYRIILNEAEYDKSPVVWFSVEDEPRFTPVGKR